MTASCMTCIYSQLTKEQYPCSECYYDNNGNPSKHEPVVEAPDINVGNIDTTTHDSIPAETDKNDGDRTSGDCISRQQAIDELHGYFEGMLETDTVCPADIYGLFECMPSAQPERKTGRWIPTTNGRGGHECSRCHEYAPCYQDGSEHLSTFCVLCGAKMEEGEQE